jgi:hypothetical protein
VGVGVEGGGGGGRAAAIHSALSSNAPILSSILGARAGTVLVGVGIQCGAEGPTTRLTLSNSLTFPSTIALPNTRPLPGAETGGGTEETVFRPTLSSNPPTIALAILRPLPERKQEAEQQQPSVPYFPPTHLLHRRRRSQGEISFQCVPATSFLLAQPGTRGGLGFVEATDVRKGRRRRTGCRRVCCGGGPTVRRIRTWWARVVVCSGYSSLFWKGDMYVL